MILAAAIVAGLILLNALYVAAEFAAVGVRRSRLRRLAEDGNPLAARLLPIVENPQQLDRYIAACQIGITLSSLILGAYAQAAIAPRLAPILERLANLDVITALTTSAVAVLLSLTTLQMILGELVPKSIALQEPTRTALATVLPMIWSLWLFTWFIWLLNGSGNAILRLVGVPATGHRHVHSPDEIELLIAESRDGGLLEPQEQVRLHRALRLGLRTARELMVPRARLASIDVSMPFFEVVRVVGASPYSRLPVYRGSLENVVGMLHTKDLVINFVEQRTHDSVMPLLKPIVRVNAGMPADRLLAFLREKRSHQAVVVEDDGRVVGLITVEDVVAELLGTVSDEFKTTQLRAIALRDGRIRLPGSMRVDQAAQALGGHWTPSSETVAAYVAAAVGHAVEPGDRFEVNGVEVEIESVEGGAITSVIAAVGKRAARP